MKRDTLFPRLTHLLGQNLSFRDFDKIKDLGKGSFGQVYLCKHKATGRQYAIKRIRWDQNDKTKRENLIAMTKNEIQILYRINNEHIIKLLDHFEDSNSVYLITEYIDGKNLYQLTLAGKTRLTANQVAEIISQACQGLSQLHNNKIIHRDIKLENLMYNHSIVKIVDLGCSNFFGENFLRKTTLGTRPYYCPELLNRQQQNDRLDIWCMGVVLYEMLFLKQPFEQPDYEKKIRKLDYSFPKDANVDADLLDLFKRTFTSKDNRLSARQMKNHPWIVKNRRDPTKYIRFQDIFLKPNVDKYRQFLIQSIAKQRQLIGEMKSQTNQLQLILKQSNKELLQQIQQK